MNDSEYLNETFKEEEKQQKIVISKTVQKIFGKNDNFDKFEKLFDDYNSNEIASELL
jgi:hypothetical protein